MSEPLLSISWSGLQRHEKCKQASLLSKSRRPLGTDIRNFVHGTIADRVIREILDDEKWPSGADLLEKIDRIFEREITPVSEGGEADGIVRWRGVNDRHTMKNFVREVVVGCRPYLETEVFPYEYQAGIRFRTPVTIPYLDGRPVQINLSGEMDILVRRSPAMEDEEGTMQPAEWRGIDLKATKNDAYVHKTLGQAIFYDLALLAMQGTPAGKRSGEPGWAFLQPGCKQAWVPVQVSDDDRTSMFTRIVNMATSMWHKDWAPRDDNKECGQCEYKSACIKFRPLPSTDGKRRISLRPQP